MNIEEIIRSELTKGTDLTALINSTKEKMAAEKAAAEKAEAERRAKDGPRFAAIATRALDHNLEVADMVDMFRVFATQHIPNISPATLKSIDRDFINSILSGLRFSNSFEADSKNSYDDLESLLNKFIKA